MKKKVAGPFFFKEPAVTGDTLLAMMDNTASVPVGTFFQLHSAPPHFSRRPYTFLDRGFPGRWIGRRGPIPWQTHSPNLIIFTGGGGLLKTSFVVKRHKM
jgi:hypothetical protein